MSLYSRIIDLQKLQEAWKHVKKNKPAAGVDEVTYEMFEEGCPGELKALHQELEEHTYQTLPVKTVTIYKGEKAREIALYAMRDKTVQQSIATELSKIFEPLFPNSTSAYRPGRSALSAIGEIEGRVLSGEYTYFLKADIRHYFDSISWKKLESMLRNMVLEEDVLELIRMNSCSRYLDMTDGEILEKTHGIFQGSGISPILSNIYLLDFDLKMKEKEMFYIRYSDDLIILSKEKDPLTRVLQEMNQVFGLLGISLNENKTILGEIVHGIDFLGYHFNINGKSVPAKAEQNLEERLEAMWITGNGLAIEDKCKKALEIIGGWQQYFRDERLPGTIYEFVALVYASGLDDHRVEMKQIRESLSNNYRDIMEYMAGVWYEEEEPRLELLEYEQFYIGENIPLKNSFSETLTIELLERYRDYLHHESRDAAIEIMQLYTDLSEYEFARFWQEKMESLEKTKPQMEFHLDQTLIGCAKDEVVFNPSTAENYLRTFVGREDIYSIESLSYGKKRHSELQTLPLTAKEINAHLSGTEIIGTYIQRQNSTVRHIILDVDVSKKVLLKHPFGSDGFEEYLEKAFNRSKEVLGILKEMGIRGYMEASGHRGFHIWIFLTEWIPVRYAHLFCENLQDKIGEDEAGEISIEYFPNKTRIRPDKPGQVIKLPYGQHIRTGRRSFFLDDEGNPCLDINAFIDGLAKYSLGTIRKILASYIKTSEPELSREVDEDISSFGNLSVAVREVLNKCNLMRYLCQKVSKTGYLTHFERLSILYVFGHMGKDGEGFVHKVMSMTINYNYNTTERFVRKRPDKPISCVKLREGYKKISAEIGCSCAFKRTKNCYPSPVLHAIALSSDVGEVTVPTSRSLTKEHEKTVIREINIHVKSQELAQKILEFKKQKRGVEKNIKKLEKELEEIFDNANVDELEIDMGLLVRREKENGYEWLIEV